MIFILALLLFTCLWADDITGDWFGKLDIHGQQLRVVFHITAAGDSLTATLDSPDQGAAGLHVSSVSFDNSILRIAYDAISMTYTGELKAGVIRGTFTQAGYDFPLDLQREAIEKPVLNRPQEPKEPFPYRIEEVQFTNTDAGIRLAGTLTLPKKKGTFPAVVMITGSGQQDRDEEIFGHKPFKVIADDLTRNGIAVLRFDDRGFGASEGDAKTATSLDFASDVKSAVAFLKSRPDIRSIGLLGHSEGGIIAPLVAVDSPDVRFIVLLAGPGLRGDKLLLLQEELIWRVDETDEKKINQQLSINRNIFKLVLEINDTDSLRTAILTFLQQSVTDSLFQLKEGFDKEALFDQLTNSMVSPWMRWFLRHDPAPVLQQVRCPVLALFGSNDLQVPAKENLSALEAALKQDGNQDYTVKEYPDLNHLFQQSETGHPDEYVKIEQTISPEVLKDISAWIRSRTGLK